MKTAKHPSTVLILICLVKSIKNFSDDKHFNRYTYWDGDRIQVESEKSNSQLNEDNVSSMEEETNNNFFIAEISENQDSYEKKNSRTLFKNSEEFLLSDMFRSAKEMDSNFHKIAQTCLSRMESLFKIIEPTLYDKGIFITKNSSSSYHAAITKATPEVKQLSKSAILMIDITTFLAKEFDLNRYQVFYLLPKVNVSYSVLSRICPYQELMVDSCKMTKYRQLSGFCNNLYNPHWGNAFRRFNRLLPPAYEDNVSKPRKFSKSGQLLPSPRLISTIVHKDLNMPHCDATLMLMLWGQFLDHDISHTASTSLTSRTGKSATIKCCNVLNKMDSHPACDPIKISEDDPFFSKYNKTCMEFVRSETIPTPGCHLGPREQVNQVSAFIDASNVYGCTKEGADFLRKFTNGKLKSLIAEKRLKDLLPLSNDTTHCPEANDTFHCFSSGDVRSNEHNSLTAMHTLWMREHNRLAVELKKINPMWNDEKLYQETKRIISALLQHITYNEFLPIVLGEDTMKIYDLILLDHGYYYHYDPKLDPTVVNVFATAAYRFGHSLIPNIFPHYDQNHKKSHSTNLTDGFFKPFNLFTAGVIDHYMLGLLNEPSQSNDQFMASQITNQLFEKHAQGSGLDLAALNIQRGRDHGLPSYNEWRNFCDLRKLETLEDLKEIVKENSYEALKTVYESVEDIDLFTGGLVERPLKTALVGPTFACLIAHQFVKLRKGDRYWYENDMPLSAFTKEQLHEIKKITMATIICNNLDEIITVQPFVMLKPNHPTKMFGKNVRRPCKNIMTLNLSKWKDVSDLDF